MRRTLVTMAVAGLVAVTSVTAASAARSTTAPDATVNLRLILTDKGARFASGPASWAKLMQLPRGTYGRVIIVNNGSKPYTFKMTGLQRNPVATIKPGKKAIIIADFLRRGDFRWTVDLAGSGGIFRIF